MRKRVFFDSSVIIAALLSRDGASYFILDHFSDDLAFEINEYVFEETRRAVERKFGNRPDMLANLFSIMGLSGMTTLQNPSKQEVREAGRVISKKDAQVLAGAFIASDFLLTFDNEFFKTSVIKVAKEKDLVILKPGDLINLLNL